MKSIKDEKISIFFSTLIIGLLVFIFNDKDRILQNLDRTVSELTKSIKDLELTISLSDKDIEIVDQKTKIKNDLIKINAKAINDLQELHKNNK